MLITAAESHGQSTAPAAQAGDALQLRAGLLCVRTRETFLCTKSSYAEFQVWNRVVFLFPQVQTTGSDHNKCRGLITAGILGHSPI